MSIKKAIFTIIIYGFLFTAGAHVRAAGFTLSHGDQTFNIDEKTLAEWKGAQTVGPSNMLKPPVNIDKELAVYPKFADFGSSPANTYNYRLSSVYGYISTLSSQIDAEVSEPKLVIKDNRATEFTPPKNGLKLAVYESSLKTLLALEQGKTSATLDVFETRPQNSLALTNDLGINELVSRGTSKFSGSPNNRRHNIKIGVEKMKGIILAPGEIFSFNEHLGPVEKEQGFLPELVIKRTGTVPELGGGLCQVSSTTFRAAMEAGLPIKERRNHAYAVQYYSPQGTDATIYPGIVDLKFVNDTPAHLLIWPYLKDKDTLIFDFYGTKDSRQVTLQKPIQYDRKTDGSMKAEWTRLVTKDGQTSTSTFKSVYQSPALFHKEEQFVAATPPPGMNVGTPN